MTAYTPINIYLILLIALTSGLVQSETLISHSSIERTPELSNLINRFGTPHYYQDFDQYSNQKFNPFFDQGAWHGFLLPENEQQLGGFTGPMIIAEEYSVFIAEQFEKLVMEDASTGQSFDLNESAKSIESFPGLLKQHYQFEKIELLLELRFVSNRTALVKTRIKNRSDKTIKLNLNWQGKLLSHWNRKSSLLKRFPEWSERLSSTDTTVDINFEKQRSQWEMMLSGESQYSIHRSFVSLTHIDTDRSVYNSQSTVSIQSNSSWVGYTAHSYFHNHREKIDGQKSIEP